MKKLICLMLAALMVLGLAACAKNDTQPPVATDAASAGNNGNAPEPAKPSTLVYGSGDYDSIKVSTSTCSLKWTRNKVVYVSREYTPDCMHRRNRHLVDHSGTCICYLTRSTGGTAYTVDYARKRGLRIIWIIHRRSIIQNVHVVLPVNESVVCHLVNLRIRVTLGFQVCLWEKVMFFQRFAVTVCSGLKQL